MVKKLRQKFVITTMMLMTVTFGIFLICVNLYAKYWDRREMLQTLEWYAESDSFFSVDFVEGEILESYANPIFAVTLDEDLNVKEIKSSSTVNRKAPSLDVIEAIYERPGDKHKWKSYLYTIKELENGSLLVITSLSKGKDGVYEILGTLALLSLGFLLLLGITLILSRFVTEPAKMMLQREKQFVSDASHELKTPLAAISVNAQALQPALGDNKHLRHILSETERMNNLIQKLLKLSYAEEIGNDIEKKEFSLSDCCEEMVLSMESGIYERGINFEYEIKEDISCIGNEDDIKQVIAILLDNAMKHTTKSGVISFQLMRDDSGSKIFVENSGQGISPEELPRIFERFYRIDKSRKNEDSSYGLGLAIAKAIVESHGGAITAESEYGKNVRFTVML